MTSPPVAAIGHDPDVLEAFYREHLALVQRFVARRVASPEDAADLTADIFVAAIDSADGYRPEAGSPQGWLIGIARNLIASHWRSSARSLDLTRKIVGRNLLDEDATERIASRIDAERRTRDLYQCLAALPEPQRAVTELVAVDGFSLVEAAAALGISAGNARVRYHRARRTLSASLPTPTEVTS